MTVQSFTIPGSDDRPMSIDLYLTEQNKEAPLVIFTHGFKGFKDWGTHELTAKYFVGQGFNFLKFNFSHNGISVNEKDFFDDLEAFSKNTFSKELFDLDQIITFALSGEKFKASSDIFLLGHSLGGGICIIQTAEDKRVKKLVTWASVCRLRNLWQPEAEEKWKNDGVLYFTNSRTNQQMPILVSLLEDLARNSERLEIDSAAKRITQPWLIVHGDSDETVPLQHAEELKRQQDRTKLLVVKDGDHVFGARHPWNEEMLPEKLKEVCDASIAFFKGDLKNT